MKNRLRKLVTLSCLAYATLTFANKDLCISLINYGEFPVNFDSLVSPGDSYVVKPGDRATLSSDHMVGSCMQRDNENDCAINVSILDGTYTNFEIIDHLPRGSLVIYKHLHQFYVDKNANIKCN